MMPVVHIDIDSLRADHLGTYGYDAPTSPNIDELADDAVQFERMYVANSPCMPSRAAFLTGRYGLNNGVETHGVRGQQLHSAHNWEFDDGNPHTQRRDYWTLPELFFQERIQSVAISSFPHRGSITSGASSTIPENRSQPKN